MFTSNSVSDRTWLGGSSDCDAVNCSSGTCQRRRKFQHILQWLTTASKGFDYMNEITAVVNTLHTAPYQQLMAPLTSSPLVEFDGTKHKIDHLAQEYLSKASKAVQHLIPIETSADGNCLYNSIVCLLPTTCVSAVELRVRTVVELVKNGAHYANKYSNLIGLLANAVCRACNNNEFSELYEIAALATVLQCEIHSVYPYVDYRAEMKCMNSPYKPELTSASIRGRLFIFWTNTMDELSVKASPRSGGVWSPNHFVPLVQPQQRIQTPSTKEIDSTLESPTKITTKNNQRTLVRVPNFSPPPPAQRFVHTDGTSPSFSNEKQPAMRSFAAERKRHERAIENEELKVRRLSTDRQRKASARQNEDELQRNSRLTYDRKYRESIRQNEDESERNERLAYDRRRQQEVRENEDESHRNERLAYARQRQQEGRENEDESHRNERLAYDRQRQQEMRENEDELQRHTRLAYDRQQKEATRAAESAEQTHERIRSVSARRRNRSLESRNVAKHGRLQWPRAIPQQHKDRCLQHFVEQTSMSTLKQGVCAVCNVRTYVNSLHECDVNVIPNQPKLHCHPDLLGIIPGIKTIPQDVTSNTVLHQVSNMILYKAGCNTTAGRCNICHQCYAALARDKVPIFSIANKAWIGDVPPELQELTIAEEKLISLYRHNSSVIKLTSPFHHHSTAQSALKGNVITFMQNIPNIVSSLPLNVEELCDTLKIIFVGAHTPNREHLRKVCGVSRQKVRNALSWLKRHNHLYHNIPVDETNVNKLPENDVPECIWSTMERLTDVADAETERAGFTSDPLISSAERSEHSETEHIPMNASAVIDVNGTNVTTEDINDHVLNKIRTDAVSRITATEAFEEATEEEEDLVYMIPRSKQPANDFSNPELLPGLYPTLFPYGCGVPEDPSRPMKVSLMQHVRYLLALEDRRFEKHHSFMFVLFNMIQRRQACLNASLMATRPYFRDIAPNLQTITSHEIESALMAFMKKPLSSLPNARINMLLQQIKTVGGHVMGSAYSRAVLRTQIHALVFNQGLPSIFMTINPADIHSRIALYFAGVDLDLDKILPHTIPSSYERAQIIAAHPVSTARFFHLLISNILKCMVEKGVLGPVKAHFGTVENQGRGSLHLHILIWLDHDLTPSQLKESIKEESFREGLLNYLEDIIKEDLSKFTHEGTEQMRTAQPNRPDHETSFDVDEEMTRSIDDEVDARSDVSEEYTYHSLSMSQEEVSEVFVTDAEELNRGFEKLPAAILSTPNPSSPHYKRLFRDDIAQLVNSSNVHKHSATCYKYSKIRDNPTCRMRMPRQIVEQSSIDIDSGEIKLRRLHATINNFNEYIISACRSNMDIKFIFNGSDAKALVYYITDYVTKTNLSFHDTFSLVLKAVKTMENSTLTDFSRMSAEEKSRRLVLRCYNTLASQQELSSMQVASYLMGWPDHYTTHEFVNIHLISVEKYLQAALINERSKEQQQLMETPGVSDEDEEVVNNTDEQFLLQPSETPAEYVFVNTRVDYQNRSLALQNVSLYDYVRYYRKKPINTNDRKQYQAQAAAKRDEREQPGRGRPPAERELFSTEHPQASSHMNIRRASAVVPVLLGPPIPRQDREETQERYYRSILTLFVPWRSVLDICSLNQTWQQAFDSRQEIITPESRKFIENIQLLHECKKDRDEHLQQVIEAMQTESIHQHTYSSEMNNESDGEEEEEIFDILAGIDADERTYTEQPGLKSEDKYFQKIMEAVDRANRFIHIHNSVVDRSKPSTYTKRSNNELIRDRQFLVPATAELLQLNKKWQRQITEEKEQKRNACINEEENDGMTIQSASDTDQSVTMVATAMLLNDDDDVSCDSIYTQSVKAISLSSGPTRQQIARTFTLNKNQTAAFMIITGHLDGVDGIQKENGSEEQLIMCVPGCGGTGKSQLIRAIAAYFVETKRARKLRKLAPTSVAAAEIDGMTVHSFLGEGRNTKRKVKRSDRAGQTKLENEWRFIEYVILDEMSMVGLSLLARLSNIITTAKHADPIVPFGGVNLILFGDYMQYSPVFDRPLYYDYSSTVDIPSTRIKKPPTENEIQQKSARALILQINCVVMLEQQMRTVDRTYQDLLGRLRKGEGTHADWLLLQTRVIGKGLQISLNNPPWNETPILVYRNELRTELNNRAVINRAYQLGQPPTVVVAQDKINTKKELDLLDLNKRLLALPDNKTDHIPGYLPLIPGMPVLLQENIACELGLSNGTPGIFRKLVYDETAEHTTSLNESAFTSDTLFIHNAQYALIEIPKSKAKGFEKLEPQIVPIPVVDKTFTVSLEQLYADKTSIIKALSAKQCRTTINVKRRGLPLVPAYSITTHKSQGQTLPKIIIDLNMPPGMVEVASAYVPLSRVKQLDDIAILRDFDISVLRTKPSKSQSEEMSRLFAIFVATKQRYSHYFSGC